MSEETDAAIKNLARDIQQIRTQLQEVLRYMKDAESEVPEKMRRFIMYFHDVHDISNFYHELGLPAPKYIITEIERCADRYRHMLDDLYDKDREGHFERVREDMSKREGNRYDWSKALAPPRRTG